MLALFFSVGIVLYPAIWVVQYLASGYNDMSTFFLLNQSIVYYERYILLVFCILLGFVYFFIPLAYVEGVVGNGGAYGFGRYIEISNAKGDAVVMVALLTSLLSYFLIFAALLFRWIRAAKWLSVLALVSPVAALFQLDFVSGVNYAGAFVYVLLSVVFFILCLTLRSSDREPK